MNKNVAYMGAACCILLTIAVMSFFVNIADRYASLDRECKIYGGTLDDDSAMNFIWGGILICSCNQEGGGVYGVQIGIVPIKSYMEKNCEKVDE